MMYLDTPDVSFMPYEDDSAYWSFCSDYTDFAATDLKLEYPEPAFTTEKVEYPTTPEAISPGPFYEQHPIMIPSPTYSTHELIHESPLHEHAPLAVPQHQHQHQQQHQQAQHHYQHHQLHQPQQPEMGPTSYTLAQSPLTPQASQCQLQHLSPLMAAAAPQTPMYPSPPMSAASSSCNLTPLPQQQHHQQQQAAAPMIKYGFSSVTSTEKGQITPEHLSMKIQNMGFHCSFPQVRSVSEKSLKLWMPLASLDENRRNIIMQKAMEKDLNPTVVFTHLQMFPDNDWAAECPEELRQYPVIGIEMGGSALDSKSKHVKRPLNSFMIYRKAQTQRARINAQRKGIKINHQTISSIVGLLWQTESGHVHEFFSEAAGVEKHLHSEQHPNYKFKPRKKAKVISKD